MAQPGDDMNTPKFAPISEELDADDHVDLDDLFYDEHVKIEESGNSTSESDEESKKSHVSSLPRSMNVTGLAAISGSFQSQMLNRRIKPKKMKKPAKVSMTEKQRIERRERNREHAKRSRIRKKFLLESLQEQYLGLQHENMKLREIVQDKIPDKAEDIFKRCTQNIDQTLVSSEMQSCHALRFLMEPDFRLVESLSSSQQNFTVSDPSLPDNPIVYASPGFLELTGYRMDQILGRNCRFLQGPMTDPDAVDLIRRGVREGRDTSVCLLNYKADGTPFWNQFFVAALRDGEGNIVNFVGVQCEVKEMSSDLLRDTLKKLPLPEDI
uniref:LOV domain-containing protein n=1 Tax=Fibrocapsa japonica TaxID=94617 RepID=A0A7S2XV25_9STRA|mmetsp:Transcript_11948/g.17618  ORF Transcript_11948/g.17618 Transcript_11948/m.17618 type:complete len:325 (+) Transcript_11948:46-1020(+)|eukprot:CAMPEP_0113939002 /NCGR_PEP_ID=MMETSP1339-20121228/5397_1 /TAXON_ID=94617 /ORGANISM="Fibrocapsa japonica" /LENGTH=324 /DNA_ID=CAMNT_0000942367 /DNA_START=38 /DNA_END=1012 /DNA_ORIENTATION=- /assembly_acc=CAM_ASM_000762